MLHSDAMSQVGVAAKRVSEAVKQTGDQTTAERLCLRSPLKSVGGCAVLSEITFKHYYCYNCVYSAEYLGHRGSLGRCLKI